MDGDGDEDGKMRDDEEEEEMRDVDVDELVLMWLDYCSTDDDSMSSPLVMTNPN
jgi:hypothetical protein